MKQLFAALRDMHPGFEVADVRLLANALEVNGRPGDDLDAEFDVAVKNAEAADIASWR